MPVVEGFKNTYKMTKGKLTSSLRGLLPLFGGSAEGRKGTVKKEKSAFVYVKYCNILPALHTLSSLFHGGA